MQKVRDEGKMQIHAHAANDCGEAYRWCIESGYYSQHFCVRGLEECVPVSAQLQPQVKMQKVRDEGKMQIHAHAANDCGEAYRWCIESGYYSQHFCVRGLEECVPVSAQLQPQVKMQELYNNEQHKIQAHAAQSDCDGAFRFCMEHYDIGFCFQGLQLCPYNTNYNK
jgi:hypothetical protein